MASGDLSPTVSVGPGRGPHSPVITLLFPKGYELALLNCLEQGGVFMCKQASQPARASPPTWEGRGLDPWINPGACSTQGKQAINKTSKASAIRGGKAGYFIHDCILKGLAHDSQIIHEILSIFKCKLQGRLKGQFNFCGTPHFWYRSGLFWGKTVLFQVQSFCPFRVLSHRIVITLPSWKHLPANQKAGKTPASRSQPIRTRGQLLPHGPSDHLLPCWWAEGRIWRQILNLPGCLLYVQTLGPLWLPNSVLLRWGLGIILNKLPHVILTQSVF